MTAALNIQGQRYGRLIAIEKVNAGKKGTFWSVLCDCGKQAVVNLDNLRAGCTRSCGCLKIEATRKRSIKHGESTNRQQSKIYRTYHRMKSRCYNPNDKKYYQYGARGIKVCDRWLNDFNNFLEDMGIPEAHQSIDRLDPNKNYEPANCRWANTHQQARTRTDNVLVSHNGQTYILKDFAKIMGVNYKSLHALVKYKGIDAFSAAQKLLGKNYPS